MIKIVNTIVFVLFSLSFLEKNLSAETPAPPNEHETLGHPSTPEYRTNNQSLIISPQPLRYIATLSPILENQEDSIAREEEIKLNKTYDEQMFRLHAFNRMAGFEQQLLISHESAFIHKFTLIDIKMHLNDGFYQKVGLFDMYQRPISSEAIRSILLPLTIMEPRDFPDWYGNRRIGYVPRFMGYAYRKKSGFWLWTDLPESAKH